MSTDTAGFAGPRIVAAATAAVIAICLTLFAVYGLGEDGVRAGIRATARTSVLCLLMVFPASALHRRWRSPATRWLMRNRRYLGLSLAASHATHLALILVLYQISSAPGVDPTTLYGGGFGYGMLFAMALTSNDASVRWLGSNWRRLHSVGIYTVWGIFLVSYLPAPGTHPIRLPIFVALLLAAGLRWWPAPKRVVAHS